MYCHERDSVVGPTLSTTKRTAQRVFPSFFFFYFYLNCLCLGWKLSPRPDGQMPTQLGVLDMKPVPLLLCSHPAAVEAHHSRGLLSLPSQGLPCTLPGPCAARAALVKHEGAVKHEDVRQPWSARPAVGWHLLCWESSPCPSCGIACFFLL